MTTETAAEKLNGSYAFAINYPSLNDEDGDQRLFINVEALGMAIEALKKKVPAEPVVIPHTNRIPSQQDVPHCPNCKENLEMYIGTEWCAGVVGYGFKYCPYCGQAIGLDN